jgi:hypothetical protein
MVHIGDFQITLPVTRSRTPYCPCSPNSTSTYTSLPLSHQVCLILLGINDPSLGCVLGLRVPDLIKVLLTEPVHLDLTFFGGLYKAFLSSSPPSFLISFFVSCFLMNAVSLSALLILLGTHCDMSL